ncbi:MAG: hypothetical protein M1544_01840 [Candidatus Marsarchaeota archaeon]|nr:hypothetical protein [Candidatus Marsarchaeota archaeon]
MVYFDKEKRLYMCEVCKLHYTKKEDAEKCQKWCSSHDSCNLSIARRSVEAVSRRSHI